MKDATPCPIGQRSTAGSIRTDSPTILTGSPSRIGGRRAEAPLESLDAAFHVATRPLEATRIALELEHILARLAVLEPEHAAITLDEHHAGARLYLLVREAADSLLRHSIASSRTEPACLATGVPEHQDVPRSPVFWLSYRSEDVPCDDAPYVPGVVGVHDPDLDLSGLPGQAGAPDDLNDLSGP